MRISARALRAGDTFRLHDWTLHVEAALHDVSTTTILTAEFEWPIHFGRGDAIELVERDDERPPAA